MSFEQQINDLEKAMTDINYAFSGKKGECLCGCVIKDSSNRNRKSHVKTVCHKFSIGNKILELKGINQIQDEKLCEKQRCPYCPPNQKSMLAPLCNKHHFSTAKHKGYMLLYFHFRDHYNQLFNGGDVLLLNEGKNENKDELKDG